MAPAVGVKLTGAEAENVFPAFAAKIGDLYYATFEAAYAAAEAGQTIELLKPVVVAAGETLTLDKAVTITYTSDVVGEFMITNNGTLVVDGATITYKYTGAPDASYGKMNTTIQNLGTMTVKSGVVENTTAKMSHASYAINTNAGATLNIEGGKVLNLNSHAIRQVSFGTAANTVNISGGYIEGTRAIWMQLPSDASAAAPEMTLNITGGELMSNESTNNLAIYGYSYGQSAEKVKISISNAVIGGNVAFYEPNDTMLDNAIAITSGTFKGAYGVYTYHDEPAAKIQITGGNFATNYAEPYALDNAYGFKANENGTYDALPVAQAGYVAQNVQTGEYITTVSKALAAAKVGETVKLIADSDESDAVLVMMKGITLDLNGFDLTAAGLAAFNGNYLVDSSENTTGLLIVPQNNLTLPKDNAELPFWNESNGYYFVTPITTPGTNNQSYQWFTQQTADGFAFSFRPGFEVEGMAARPTREKYIADSGLADNGIELVLRVTWTGSQGQIAEQDFIYSEELIKKAYTAGSLTIKMNNLPVDQVNIMVVLRSNAGVEFVGAVSQYNAPTA